MNAKATIIKLIMNISNKSHSMFALVLLPLMRINYLYDSNDFVPNFNLKVLRLEKFF